MEKKRAVNSKNFEKREQKIWNNSEKQEQVDKKTGNKFWKMKKKNDIGK